MADADRLDMLPDALLSIIVSSLPFKEAVRTSILSKRWVKIWKATKNIELQESFFVRREESDQRIKDARRRAFIDFSTKFARIYQEPTVRKFSLSFSNPRGFLNEIEACIRFAVARNVESLELDFSDPTWSEDDGENHADMFDLPPIVYGHENLRSLKLFSCSFRAAEFAKLVALKHLCLGWVEVGIGEIRALLQKCKMLESLRLKKCWNVTHLEIGGKDLRLRSLAIEKCSFLHDWLSIEAPNLTYFRYFGSVGSFRLEVNGCLEEADLDFEIEDDHDSSEVANLLYVLLDSLYPAKVLSVCSSLLQVIPHGDEPIRMQAPLNVQHLKLRTNIHPNEFYGITFLLNSCPHLKKLTLILGQGRIFHEYEPPFPMDITSFWATNMIVINCLSTSLEIVEAKGFTGKEHEIQFLAYLLHYGRCIKLLSLTVDSDDIANKQLYIGRAQVLNNIRPASENIQHDEALVFHAAEGVRRLVSRVYRVQESRSQQSRKEESNFVKITTV